MLCGEQVAKRWTTNDWREGSDNHFHIFQRRYVYCEAGGCPVGTAADGTGGCKDGSTLKEEKLLGQACGRADTEGSQVGNPCDAATGNKYQAEIDYAGGEAIPGFTRHYNSQLNQDLGLGIGWIASFSKRLELYETVVQIRQGGVRAVNWIT